MRILIVKLSAIGDVVHSLPVLSELRRMYPDSEIHWLVEEGAAGLLENHPLLDRVILCRRKSWLKRLKKGEPGVLREVAAFIREFRSGEYDLVIDLQNLAKSSFWVLLARSERKLGFWGTAEYAYAPLTEKIGPEDFNLHAVDRYLTFISYLGGSVDNPEFVVPIAAKHMARADELLAESGLAGKQVAAVHTFALWPTKLWTVEGFRGLVKRLQEELDIGVIFTGSESDRRYVDEVSLGLNPEPANLCGRSNLLELAALFKRCAAAVTTDTGPMHLAAAVGTPVVGLFGPTDPARTGPYGKQHTALRAGLDCSPCFRKSCPDIRCMKHITVDRVFDAVKEKLIH